MPIVEYSVAVPPTSGEVWQKANEAIFESGVLHLILRAAQEVPRVEDREIDMNVRNGYFPGGIGATFSGVLDSGENVVVRISAKDEEAAKASIISAD